MRAKLANPTNALQPAITTVVPSVGAYTSKTQVAVIGTGFMYGASLTLGSKECTDVQYVSDTTLICTAQPQRMGKASVLLVNPNQKSAALEDAFAFTDALEPTAGFALTSGGGISRSPSSMAISSIGEFGAPVIQRSASHIAITGIQAISVK